MRCSGSFTVVEDEDEDEDEEDGGTRLMKRKTVWMVNTKAMVRLPSTMEKIITHSGLFRRIMHQLNPNSNSIECKDISWCSKASVQKCTKLDSISKI